MVTYVNVGCETKREMTCGCHEQFYNRIEQLSIMVSVKTMKMLLEFYQQAQKDQKTSAHCVYFFYCWIATATIYMKELVDICICYL